MGSYMVPHQLRGAQRERASISDMRARNARAKRGGRARCASKARESTRAAPRARTLRASLAHVARARRARTNKLSKSQISSPRAEISSPHQTGIWRAYSYARDVRARGARGARRVRARCAHLMTRARASEMLPRARVCNTRASRARACAMLARNFSWKYFICFKKWQNILQ